LRFSHWFQRVFAAFAVDFAVPQAARFAVIYMVAIADIETVSPRNIAKSRAVRTAGNAFGNAD